MTTTDDRYVPAGRTARVVCAAGTSGAADVLTPRGWVRAATLWGGGEAEVPRSLDVSRVRAVRISGGGPVVLEVA